MARSKAQSVIKTDDDELYYGRCAGIDVHKKLLVVCLRIGRKHEIREFGTRTHQLTRQATLQARRNNPR